MAECSGHRNGRRNLRPPSTVNSPAEPTPGANLRFDFDLRTGEQGWRADYSDYTQPAAPGIDFRDELEERGYPLSGKNVSDDLFMTCAASSPLRMASSPAPPSSSASA